MQGSAASEAREYTMDHWRIFMIVVFTAMGILGLVCRKAVARNMFQARPPGINSPEQLVPAAVAVGLVAFLLALLTALDLLLGR